jgi:hypothetical protein
MKHLEFRITKYMEDSNIVDKLKTDYQTMRLLTSSFYRITVDNSKSNSNNINIDYPTFYTNAVNEAEAVGLMLLSNFPHKHLKINNIATV